MLLFYFYFYNEFLLHLLVKLKDVPWQGFILTRYCWWLGPIFAWCWDVSQIQLVCCQGVYWRHNNHLLTSRPDGLVTVSPLARQSNCTFSISVSVWLTSTAQSGDYQCVPTNTHQAAVLVHVLDGVRLSVRWQTDGSLHCRWHAQSDVLKLKLPRSQHPEASLCLSLLLHPLDPDLPHQPLALSC